MIVLFHALILGMTEWLFVPRWQKEVRDITRDLAEALGAN